MHHPDARGYEEIATALDIPVETVGSRISRARKKLRKVLGDVNPIGERRWTS
ncbi:RNA polymerase sigma factor [Nonomuraea sp. AD125B]|uniref:RNA polymerase sigma factor n=1 Tax=Nonomuraea sp. AD125B TaxID=3242897 RepID=UPI0035275504